MVKSDMTWKPSNGSRGFGVYGLAALRVIPYSGKLSKGETFANFAVLWLFAKVFSAKSWGVASFGTAKASNPRKFHENRIFHKFAKPLQAYGDEQHA